MQPYPILSRLSRRCYAVPRLAARRFGTQPRRAGGATSAASEQRPPARSAGGHKGVFGGCVTEVLALQCRLPYLSSALVCKYRSILALSLYVEAV
jgi:hypothetical protein